MTWARGFFRLWVVLAVAWCAGSVALLGTDEFRGLWQPYGQIKADFHGISIGSFDDSVPRNQLRKQMLAGINRLADDLRRSGDVAEAQKQSQGAEGTADELLKALDNATSDRAKSLHTALLITLLPPLALLVLGLAVAWIVNGFRTRQQT